MKAKDLKQAYKEGLLTKEKYKEELFKLETEEKPKKIVKKKLHNIITEEELLKILKKTKHPHHRTAFALGFYQAMRVSELVKLEKADINRNQKLLHIREAKGHKDRIIPIAPQCMAFLRHIPLKSNTGKRIKSTRALQYAWENATKKILGKQLNIHILRHSGCTFYINKGWSTLQVQQFAGHSKSTITEIYTHISPTALVERMWEK